MRAPRSRLKQGFAAHRAGLIPWGVETEGGKVRQRRPGGRNAVSCYYSRWMMAIGSGNEKREAGTVWESQVQAQAQVQP